MDSSSRGGDTAKDPAQTTQDSSSKPKTNPATAIDWNLLRVKAVMTSGHFILGVIVPYFYQGLKAD